MSGPLPLFLLLLLLLRRRRLPERKLCVRQLLWLRHLLRMRLVMP